MGGEVAQGHQGTDIALIRVLFLHQDVPPGMKEEGMIGTLHVDLDPFLDLFPLAMMREITWQIKGLQGDLGQFQKNPIHVKGEISSLLTGLIKERMDGILTMRTTHMVDLNPEVLGKTLVATQDLVLGPTALTDES